jgi:WD40 repeat protein
MDEGRPDYTFNFVDGDVSGVVVQARSISGGVHVHVPSRNLATSRSRAAERPSWLAKLSDGTAGVLLDPRRILTLGPPRAGELLVDLPFAGVRGRPVTVALQGATATVLELAEPVEAVGAPLAAPALCESHEFITHGFPGTGTDIAQVKGVLDGTTGPGGQWFGVRPAAAPWESDAGFSGAPVFDRVADAVVGLLAPGSDGPRVLPLVTLLEPWPWLRDLLGWRLDHDPALRTHWLPRARGSEVETDSGTSYFTGRTEARGEVCAWLDGDSPLLVVTGGPGVGKSALLAHILVGADPRWAGSASTAGPRPALDTVDVAVHLKGLTFDDVVAQLATLSDVQAADSGDLLVVLRDRRAAAGRPVVVLCDALDEAATVEESLRIARLLTELAGAGVARVVVGVRTAPAGSMRARVHRALGRSTPTINLESERFLRRDDIVEYVARRLAGEDTDGRYRDAPTLGAIAADIAARSRHNFLIAQLTSRWLLLPGTPVPGAGDAPDEELPSTVGEAMEKYLDTFGPDKALVERFLTALAFAVGGGLPGNELWLRLADALTPGYSASAADLARVFDSAASYLVETTVRPDGSSTYRLYHEVLDEHLRENCVVRAPHSAVVKALKATVPEREHRLAWEDADPYIRSQLAGHAARAGSLDDLIVDGGFLVHADPSPLLAVLHEAVTTQGRLAVACYRASSADHRHLDPSARARVLALDAARLGARDLQAQFTQASSWPVRFATGARQHGALLATLRAEQGNISSMAAGMYDGRSVALSGSEGGRMRLWDVADQRPIGNVIDGLPWSSYQSPELALTTLDDRLLAVVGGSNQVQVWDLLEARLIVERTIDPYDSIHGVAVTQLDGRSVWGTVGKRGLCVWDLRTHELVAGPMGEHLYALAFTELDGGPVAVTGDFTALRVWDLRSGQEIGPAMDTPESIFNLAVTELAGRQVVVTGGADETGTLRLWDLRTHRAIGEPRTDHGWSVSGVAVAELDGRPVAVTSSGHNNPGPDDEDTTLLVWDLLDWRRLGRPLAGHTQGTQAVAVTEVDGRPVAVTGGGWDGTVRLWDLTLADQQLGDPAPGHGLHITELAVLDRGGHRRALSVGLDDTAFLWDLDTHRVIMRIPVDFTNVVGIEELDGHLLLVLAGIGLAEVLHSGTGLSVPLKTRNLAEKPYARSVEAGATGRLDGRPVAALATAGNVLRLYDVATGRVLGPRVDIRVEDERREQVDRPVSVALMTVRGRPAAVVASGHLDPRFTVDLFDLVDGSRLAVLEPAVSQAITTAVVDGRPVVVTAGPEGVLRVWDAEAQRTLHTIATGARRVRFLTTGLLHGRPVVLAAGHDGSLITWDLATGKACDEIRLPGTCRGIALGERGLLVVAIENDIAVFETEVRGVVPELGTQSDIAGAVDVGRMGDEVRFTAPRSGRQGELRKWWPVLAVAVVSSALAVVINFATRSPAGWQLWAGVVILTVASAYRVHRAARSRGRDNVS